MQKILIAYRPVPDQELQADRKEMMKMMNMPNTISVHEAAKLLGTTEPYIRERVKDGTLRGLAGGRYVIPRASFYKWMGWQTDEEILHGYEMSGTEMPENEK